MELGCYALVGPFAWMANSHFVLRQIAPFRGVVNQIEVFGRQRPFSGRCYSALWRLFLNGAVSRVQHGIFWALLGREWYIHHPAWAVGSYRSGPPAARLAITKSTEGCYHTEWSPCNVGARIGSLILGCVHCKTTY